MNSASASASSSSLHDLPIVIVELVIAGLIGLYLWVGPIKTLSVENEARRTTKIAQVGIGSQSSANSSAKLVTKALDNFFALLLWFNVATHAHACLDLPFPTWSQSYVNYLGLIVGDLSQFAYLGLRHKNRAALALASSHFYFLVCFILLPSHFELIHDHRQPHFMSGFFGTIKGAFSWLELIITLQGAFHKHNFCLEPAAMGILSYVVLFLPSHLAQNRMGMDTQFWSTK